MKAQQAWQAVLGQLKMELSKAVYDTWVKKTQFIRFEETTSTFHLGADNAYACDWLSSRLKSTVVNKLSGMMARPVQVEFSVWLALQAEKTEETHEEVVFADTQGEKAETYLNTRYRFDNFIVGQNNRLAQAACLAVVDHLAVAYNPLFLYSGVGMGKTHLLHAIGNAVAAKGGQVLYVSSEEFTNDLVASIRTKTQAAFREKYRQVDVLLIDDIQFIVGKEATQEEFFHTFNTLHGQEKQIVMTSDRAPKAMSTLEERLRSRFEWGLTVDIQPPDYETRLAILRSKAERAGRDVPMEVMTMIARQVQANIRELEGAWNRVLAYADLTGVALTPELASSALADFLPQPSDLNPGDVLGAVSRYFGISTERLMSRDRSKDVVLPRQMAMYLLREQGNISLPKIGQELGGRDHTTVMYGCDKMAEMIETDDRVRRQVLQIKEQIVRNAQQSRN